MSRYLPILFSINIIPYHPPFIFLCASTCLAMCHCSGLFHRFLERSEACQKDHFYCLKGIKFRVFFFLIWKSQFAKFNTREKSVFKKIRESRNLILLRYTRVSIGLFFITKFQILSKLKTKVPSKPLQKRVKIWL